MLNHYHYGVIGPVLKLLSVQNVPVCIHPGQGAFCMAQGADVMDVTSCSLIDDKLIR